MLKRIYGKVLDEFIFKVVFLCLNPGLLVALQEQVHSPVPGFGGR